MPPIRAASARLIPSTTAASDSRRRLWLACLEAAASRRSSSVEKSALTVTAVAMARILPRHGISSTSRGKSPASQNGRPLVSVVAMDPLVLLVPLLRLDRHRRNRAGFEAAQRDRLAGDLAIAIGAVVDARDSGIDLGDELALAVARPELDRAVGLGGGTIGEVRVVLALGLKGDQSVLGFAKDLVLPIGQLAPIVLPLPLVHERLFVAWAVSLVDLDHFSHSWPLQARSFAPPLGWLVGVPYSREAGRPQRR